MMNAIVELLPARKVKQPPEVLVAELRREVRELKRELKAERAHSVEMLAIMRRSTGARSFFASIDGCNCSQCTCTPTRSEMLRGR